MRAIWCLVMAAGCVEPRLVPCGELACPATAVCIAGACASAGDVTACDGLVEAAPCASEPHGFCASGVCVASVCGDGRVAPDEACDDGNRVDGDGCSADCRSTELCGNGIVDHALGESCDDGTVGLSGDGCTSRCNLEYDTWRDVTTSPIAARSSHAMAYDTARARTVLFGGLTELGVFDDTWEFDGGNWVQAAPTVSPPARSGHAMATGPTGIVLFGGTTLAGVVGDTWTWDGIRWIARTGLGPPARTESTMAYDSSRHRVILFGGLDINQVALADTWAWDGASWSQLAPAKSPDARSEHVMTYDVARDRIVVFGGGKLGGDTWEFDGTTWAEVTPASSPPPRIKAVMAYDVGRRHAVLFGGVSGIDDQSDTWTWDGAAWTDITTASKPDVRQDAAAAFDLARGEMVLQGGIFQPGTNIGIPILYKDTWQLALVWTVDSGGSSPGPRHSPLFAFDSRRGRGVLHAGVHVTHPPMILTDTFEWDGRSWSYVPTSSGPDLNGCGAYDAARGVVVGFDGQTWTWDGVAWIQQTTLVMPPAAARAIAYDAARERIVLVGGGTDVAETWEWDGVAWVERSTPTGPPARGAYTALAYDARRQVTVLFDGATATTWEWDGVAWRMRVPATVTPPVRDQFVMVYEATRQRVLVFGGRDGAAYLDDTWEWDGELWSERAPILSPSRRYAAAATYDTTRGQVVMFGGAQTDDLGETWTYDFATTADPKERCADASADTDGDGLAGCADPDCWGRCTPLCPPGTTCPADAPRCGDGSCAPIEDYAICPDDCVAP